MMKLYNVVMVLLLSSIRVTSKESPSASRNHTLLYTNSSIGDAKHSKPKSLLPVQPGKEEVKSKGARFSGDLIIGGLFPVHKKALNGCGEIQPDRGLQRVEAMLFTIDHINRNKDILPDVTLGVNILDTCSRETYALDQALEYVRASVNRFDPDHFRCDDGSNPILVSAPENVVAVVGGSYSSVSIQVANLLRLFKIPQVSYASTSAALSDKTRFELFARTVPPDNYQAKAMADIVQYFNWSYVNTVASEGDYGEMGIDSFRQESRARNVCLAVSEKVSQSATPERFDEIIRRLMTKPTSRVVVLFLRVEDAKEILQAARRQNVSGHFVWVASDGWGKEEMPVKGNDLFGEGAITIELQSSHIHDFDVYFKKLNPIENLRNPWFIEYWEHIHECIFEDAAILRHLNLYPHSQHRLQQQKTTVRRCTGREVLSPKHYTQESKMQFVFDAVYSLAHALHRMFEDNCGRVRGRKAKLKCIRTLKIDGEVLYRTYLLNISFDDGYGANVKFDRFGDGIGRYNIMNYRRNRATRKFEYVNIGRWNSGLIMNSNERVTWTGGTYDVPISQCSRPCETGQIKHVQQGDACCWVCTSCDPSEIVQDEYTCEQCESGWWPSPDKDRCVQLEVQYMQWESPYALVPVGLSVTGIIFTCMVIVTFIRKIETPIVKASGRELSFMLFAGFLICYLLTFVLLAKPSPVICGIQRFGVGFGFAVTYSSLLTKTNRISRIFDSARHSAKRPAFISPQSQVVIALMLVSVQVIGAIVWLVLDPPHVRLYHPFERRDEIVLKCGLQDQWFMLSLIYNMFLILVCTLYAIKTRKIPENFNESKYIGFAMYTTCIIWLAFVPIYFGTLNSFQVQITTLCISISLSATVALVCLFVPKLHVIWFQSEKNVRKLTMKPSFNYKKSTSSNVITTDLGFGGRPSNTSATVVAGTSSIVSAGCHTRFSTPTVTEMERSGVQMEEDFMLNCQSSLLTAHRIQPATDDDGIERLEADMDNIALRERHDCIASIDTVYKL